MSHSRRSIIACAITAAALFARNALAGVVYTELGDSGTRVTTDYATGVRTSVSLAAPYGGHTVTPFNGGWLISFSPTAQFAASTSGGSRVETDGKITFTLAFDAPIYLSAMITEGGTYATSGTGIVSSIAGGIVVETVDPLPYRETIGGTSSLAAFNTDSTWTSTIDLGTFSKAYTTYKFSIDNYLRADALTPGTAAITKDHFSIYIPPPGGDSQPAPLPLAAVSGGAVMAAALLFRKRLARSAG